MTRSRRSLYLQIAKPSSAAELNRTLFTKESGETADNDVEGGVLQSLVDLADPVTDVFRSRHNRTLRTAAKETLDNDQEMFWLSL